MTRRFCSKFGPLTIPFTGSARGITAITLGSTLGQATTFALSPILTRMFPPSAFGIYSVTIAVATILASLMTLRAETLIPIAADSRHALGLAGFGVISIAITTSLSAPILAIYALTAGSQSKFSGWIWFAVLTGAAMASMQILNGLALRDRLYGGIARRNFLQSALTVSLQLVAGLIGLIAGGLLYGALAGQLIALVSMFRVCGIRIGQLRHLTTISEIKAARTKHSSILKRLVPSAALNALAFQLPLFLLTLFYGLSVAGQFGVMQRALTLPFALIGTSVAQVYFAELSRNRRQEGTSASKLFWTATKRLTIVGIPIGLLIAMLGPSAFHIVFGDQWVASGLMAQAMAMGIVAQLIAGPTSQTLIVYQRASLQLGWDVLRVLTVIGVTTAAWAAGASALTAVWLYSLTSLLYYTALWEMGRRIIRNQPKDANKQGDDG